jgi:hypothetical protein
MHLAAAASALYRIVASPRSSIAKRTNITTGSVIAHSRAAAPQRNVDNERRGTIVMEKAYLN